MLSGNLETQKPTIECKTIFRSPVSQCNLGFLPSSVRLLLPLPRCPPTPPKKSHQCQLQSASPKPHSPPSPGASWQSSKQRTLHFILIYRDRFSCCVKAVNQKYTHRYLLHFLPVLQGLQVLHKNLRGPEVFFADSAGGDDSSTGKLVRDRNNKPFFFKFCLYLHVNTFLYKVSGRLLCVPLYDGGPGYCWWSGCDRWHTNASSHLSSLWKDKNKHYSRL